jgi:hypothetical protein
VAALLLSASPGMSASAIENAIVETGAPIVDFRSGRTFPRVDARAAFREVTKYLEIDPGGGAGNNDCLLAWNVLPPDIVRRSRNPVASCVDGDTICDADQISGQCTFLLSLCFNSHDPLLPFCATDEAITRIEILEPSSQAVAGSTERANADVIAASLPNVPINRADICSGLIPIVVPRNGRVGGALVRIAASTATRRDSDRFLLRCLAD